MKKISTFHYLTLLITALLLSLNLLAGDAPKGVYDHSENFDFANITSVKIVEQSDACTVFELTDINGVRIFSVVAAIATNWLPDAVEYLTQHVTDNPEIIKIMTGLTAMIVEMKEESIYAKISAGIRQIAKRGYKMSRTIFFTNDRKKVKTIKNVFDAAKLSGNIPWESEEALPLISYGYYQEFMAIHPFSDRAKAQIITDQVVLRTRPIILSYNKTRKLDKGTIVKVLGVQVVTSSNGKQKRLAKKWYKVYYESRIGWISEDDLQIR